MCFAAYSILEYEPMLMSSKTSLFKDICIQWTRSNILSWGCTFLFYYVGVSSCCTEYMHMWSNWQAEFQCSVIIVK